MEIIKPSLFRTEPECAFARQCGGCQLQALTYEKQLEFKEKKVRGHLERIGGFTQDYSHGACHRGRASFTLQEQGTVSCGDE